MRLTPYMYVPISSTRETAWGVFNNIACGCEGVKRLFSHMPPREPYNHLSETIVESLNGEDIIRVRAF